MNPTPLSNSLKNGIVAAIGLLVLLIGTATGNAYVMLAMAIIALLAITMLVREHLRGNVLFAIFATAVAAFVVAMAIAKL